MLGLGYERPRHPLFEDEISPTSPNAAARFAWLGSEWNDDHREPIAWVDRRNVAAFSLTEETDGITAAETSALLEKIQPWIMGVIEASKLDAFDLYLAEGPFVQRWSDDDPRQACIHGSSWGLRALQADAVRLWAAGSRDEAIDRVVATLRIPLLRSQDCPSLILVLQTAGLLQRAAEFATVYTQSPEFTDVHRHRLLTAVERFDREDPVGAAAHARKFFAERAAFIEQHISGDEPGEPFIIELSFDYGEWAGFETSGFKALLDELVGDSPEERTLIEVIEEYDSLITSMSMDDFRTRFRESQEIRRHIESKWWTPNARKDVIREVSDGLRDEPTNIHSFAVFPGMSAWQVYRESKEALDRLRESLRP